MLFRSKDAAGNAATPGASSISWSQPKGEEAPKPTSYGTPTALPEGVATPPGYVKPTADESARLLQNRGSGSYLKDAVDSMRNNLTSAVGQASQQVSQAPSESDFSQAAHFHFKDLPPIPAKITKVTAEEVAALMAQENLRNQGRNKWA